MRKTNYSDQVFINCPFERKYAEMFRCLVFTVLDCGLIPRCALEIDNAAQARLETILKIIAQCKYGIHDLSRVELDNRSGLPRFNMPFELGIFYGAKTFGGQRQRRKNCIILERDKYRHQRFISDLSGIDVVPHGNSEKKAVVAVRKWLVTATHHVTIPDGSRILERYEKFESKLKAICKKEGRDLLAMPFVELTVNMSDWLKLNWEIRRHLFQR